MTKIIPHPKGTVLYLAHASWIGIKKPCPVCAGHTVALVKPVGSTDDAGCTVNCSYCRSAVDDGLPIGHVIEDWTWAPEIEQLTVEGVVITDGPIGGKVCYIFNHSGGSHNTVEHQYVYTSLEEALKGAKEQVKQVNDKEQKNRLASMTWTVGYAKMRIADAKRELAIWEEHLCKVRNRKR